jgi:uncharacterized membrane protein YeaQ/YmgE (transglycosylase-associated protein family)
MSILAWIVFGLIAGFIAKIINKKGAGFFLDIVLGIVGAVVGGRSLRCLARAGLLGSISTAFFVSVDWGESRTDNLPRDCPAAGAVSLSAGRAAPLAVTLAPITVQGGCRTGQSSDRRRILSRLARIETGDVQCFSRGL